MLPKSGRVSDDKKADRKRIQELKKEHKLVSALAGKALPALQPVGDRLFKLLEHLATKTEQLPEMTVKQMEESKALLTQLKTSFQAVMRKVSQNQSVCWADVPVDSEKDFQSKLKTLQECAKALQTAKKSVGK